MNYNEFEQVGRNLYKKGGKYYRLFGTHITDNKCWIINPKMVELRDINIASGNDFYGDEIVISDVMGTVPRNKEYIRYSL
jgi:hypothetical protein